MANPMPRADHPPADQPAPVDWRVVFLLFTAAGVLRFTYLYLDDVARSVPGTAPDRLIEEATGAYAALLLFPLVLLVERAFPLSNGRWRRHWPLHALAFVGYSAIHTTMLALSRAWLFPLLGRGAYDYGRMPTRYFMEAPEDFIAYCSFIGVLTLIRVQRLLHERELRATVLERDAATARLEALSLRLQPHFLFNALNTISSVVYEDPVAADTMIGRLGELLRRALHTSDRQHVSVGEEIETVRAYLSFIEARFGERARCIITVDPSAESAAVPAFLLQPLVENAVKHGTSLEQTRGEIRVEIERADGELEITVENEVDRSSGAPLELGTGLQTTRDRLRLLYGDRARLVAASRDNRFRVQIALPHVTAPLHERTQDAELLARADR